MNSDLQVLIIIATYNEIENLPRLIDELSHLIPTANLLVIDDGSPDGTGAWCDTSLEKYPQLQVLHRTGKLGLGSATVLGFATALERGVDLIATLDADFSHDPVALKMMLEKMSEPATFRFGVAIGSRYIAGGQIIGWPWHRKLASRFVNRYARWLLRLTTLDNSGAFRIYRRSTLQKIELSNIRSLGYAYLEEILWRLQQAEVEVIEFPITFRDREQGKSKASLAVGLAVFWQLTQLGLRRRL